ncbi:hypothetical protein HRI_003413600 [Hibiscus trionum]|uniref:Uncharacterized protein n=1 Tax=Hibiscus trionum TaxID=183268 RepID=A0A9W7MDE4_HIBTR|nr:hypothetical protein HRI_003413600 [Hibiscus trionum]
MTRKPDPSNGGTNKHKKGIWSPEEDVKLVSYMLSNCQGCWSDVARNAGLQRCGKSCRLRWINYLRPDLKRGAFSPQEDELIVHLHSIFGNRLSSTISPNDSDSSASEHNNDATVGTGFMSMLEQEVYLTYMDLSSNSFLQSMVPNHTRNSSPMLEHGRNTVGAAVGCFDPAGSCVMQVGVNGDGLLGESEMFGSVENGIERELHCASVGNTNDNNRSKFIGSADVGSFWIGDELKGGEWDLEYLMKDVSPFPFLDFQSSI